MLWMILLEAEACKSHIHTKACTPICMFLEGQNSAPRLKDGQHAFQLIKAPHPKADQSGGVIILT